MKTKRNYIFIPSIIFLFYCCCSCKKLVQVSEPVNTITSPETFSTDANATSAVIAIYNDMISGYNQNFDYGNGLFTCVAGLSADELNYFGSNTIYSQFQLNTLKANNAYLMPDLWNPVYYDIYISNAVIEGLQASATVSGLVKDQLIGEAKFLRAFCHFYLVNMYGAVPLVTTTAWAKTDTFHRSAVPLIYQQIIQDLKDAEGLLGADYAVSGGERIRANKWVATALLARVYLFSGDWKDAEDQATAVIGNGGLYALTPSLNDAFSPNSTEAILQLQPSSALYPYTTREGNQLIPANATSQPSFYLTQGLLAAFETGDQRKIAWIDSTLYAGTTYYYPYKYKVRLGASGSSTEYYMLLRLAEQYLIRAEARAQQNTDLTGAIGDLNTIRERAGLNDLPGTLDQSQVLAAVAQERRIELFAEWGHRWLDLKRTAQASAVLNPLKPNWNDNAQLYPIPHGELIIDPNLTQNPGYN